MSDPIPSTLEVDFHKNITDLYRAITASDWDEAIRAVKRNPEEAKTWVVRKCDENPDKNLWRFLPIHSACARRPPSDLIRALVAAYPEGARCMDDQGMHAIHYACGNQASREIMRSLLVSYPDGAKVKDPRGMLPMHYLACWGPSSMSVVDMIMVANRDITDSKDEDGNTPMDLAKEADYPEKNAVVAALRRWSYQNDDDSQQPTLLSDMSATPSYNPPNYSTTTPSYKVIGSKFRALSIDDEKKSDDLSDGLSADVITCISSPGTVKKLHDMDDHISVMEIESKEDKLEISMLQYEMKQRNDMIETLKKTLTQKNEECHGLRNTLADITERHEAMAGMNKSLLAMVEQQEVVLKATRTREEQWEKLASLRRQRLRDLVQMEEEDTIQEVDLRNILAKQAHEMAAIKAEINDNNGW